MTISAFVKVAVFTFSIAVSAEAYACECDAPGYQDGLRRGQEHPCPDPDPVPPQNFCWIEPWLCQPPH